jgi:AcrR family transcriptional regulator
VATQVSTQPSQTQRSAIPPSRGKAAARSEEEQADVGAEAPSARERILLAAERLFAEHGLSGVGLRAITTAANVNLAAISYHFGSKEGLLEALFAARAAPIAQARLRLLAECTERAGGAPALEDLLDAFVRPTLILAGQSDDGGQAFGRLRARLATEPEQIARRILAKAFDASSKRFIDAIASALPNIPRAETEWRFHFMLGAMVYTMANSGRIQALTDGRCDPGDIGRAMHHMIPFLAAGFRAPPAPPEPRPKAVKTRKATPA